LSNWKFKINNVFCFLTSDDDEEALDGMAFDEEEDDDDDDEDEDGEEGEISTMGWNEEVGSVSCLLVHLLVSMQLTVRWVTLSCRVYVFRVECSAWCTTLWPTVGREIFTSGLLLCLWSISHIQEHDLRENRTLTKHQGLSNGHGMEIGWLVKITS